MKKWLLAICRAGLTAGVLMAAGVSPAHASPAVPPAGYGAGPGYCTSYAGGAASPYSFDGVYACDGSTTGATTFDNPGSGVYAWQCVELSARFLWVADGIWAGPGTGVTSGANLVSAVHAQHPQIPVGTPGPRSVPVAGDVISLGPGGGSNPISGHTAVVISANSATGQFEIMSENDPENGAGEQSLQVDLGGGHNGQVAYGGHWTTASWLELRYYGDIVQWDGDTKAQKTAWRVGADGRRHWIPSISDYWCLYNGGVDGPYVLPATVLDTVVPDDPGSWASCGGDLNGDGIVNIYDLSILLSEWGSGGHQGDINLNGKVDIFDLSIMLSQWGKSPTPTAVTTPAASIVKPAAKTSGASGAPASPAVLARPRQANGVGSVAGNDTSASPSISAAGNIVVFGSLASNLVSGDTNGVLDVFAWNRPAGTLTRVSAGAGGSQLSMPSGDAKISPNGRYVAFDSGGDVYVKDLRTGALERISQPNGDPAAEPNQAVYADAVTSSGLVIFESKATNLVAGATSGVSEVFARQLQAAPVELVSVSSDASGGTAASADSYAGAADGDGRFVVFASRAGNLATTATNGHAGIFVRDRVAGTTTLVSGPPAGKQANGDADFPSISANGQLVAFNSSATNLVAGNPHGFQQVYVRNLVTSALRRVSQANAGTAGNGDSTEPAISGDGSRVAFRSVATNLVTGDSNYADDVFVQDLPRHLISRVSVTRGLAQGNSSSFGPSLSSDGKTIAFSSDATNLTGAAAGTPEQVIVRDVTQLPLSGATPTITGAAKVGDRLTAHPGNWGPSGVTLRYQWYAAGAAISGATAPTLNLTAAQYGRQITVRVTASKAGYATATATSKATAKVTKGTIIPAVPTISGTVRAGQTLTANAGPWKPSGVTLKYQWYVSGQAINGATGRTLKLSGTWKGKTITVTVTGSKGGYSTTARSSKPTGKVAP